jgi:hypothetical protein
MARIGSTVPRRRNESARFRAPPIAPIDCQRFADVRAKMPGQGREIPGLVSHCLRKSDDGLLAPGLRVEITHPDLLSPRRDPVSGDFFSCYRTGDASAD